MSPTTVTASGTLVASASAASATSASAAAYLLALGLTLLVEVPVYLVLAARFACLSRPLALAGAVGVNLLTHPIVYAVALAWPHPVVWVLAELGAVAVEALGLAWAWRVPRPSAWLWLGAVAANALSTAVGLVVLG
jgi:hypothetical protein